MNEMKTFIKVKLVFKVHKTLLNCKQEVAKLENNGIRKQSLVYKHGGWGLRKTMDLTVCNNSGSACLIPDGMITLLIVAVMCICVCSYAQATVIGIAGMNQFTFSWLKNVYH